MPDIKVRPPEQKRQMRRADRLAAQEMLWAESGLDRVRKCGRYLSAGNDLGVALRVSEGQDGARIAGFGGLQTCGSVWACPVCSAKVAAVRQGEVETAVRAWQADGGGIVFASMTMRHHKGQSLKALWSGLSDAWGCSTSGSAWIEHQESFGLGSVVPRVVKSGKRKGQLVMEVRVPWLRVVEVTVGDNGWHVHVHCLFFVNRPVADETAQEFVYPMWDRWSESLQRNGFAAPLRDSGGLNVQAVHGDADNFGDYFTKHQYDGAEVAALEVTRGDLKDGRRDNRTPFQVLRSVYTTGDAEDLAIWQEWERSSKGRRQLTWSAGLRDAVGLLVELTDEEIAELEHGGEVIAYLTGASYRRMCRTSGRRAELLAHVEEHGGAGVIALLIGWKLDAQPPLPT